MKIKSNFPFDIKKVPFFYGWVIMLAGTIGIIFSIPGQTMGVSAFTDHLIDALGLTRDQLSYAYMFGTIGSSFLLTKAGKMWDKQGARIVGGGAAILLAVFLVIGSASVQITQAITSVLHLTQTTVAFIVIMIVFFGIRFSGQGVLTLVSRNVTMKWFDRQRGLANSISSTAVSYGFSIAPVFLVLLINRFEWQGAWQVLALMMLGFVVFFTIFVRDNPEDCGTIPDGKPLPLKRKGATGFENRKQYTLAEARKTWVLWVYSITLAFYSFYVTGFTFNVESIFETNGYLGKEGFEIFPKIAYVSITVSIMANIISDYIKLQYLLFLLILGAFGSTIGTAFIDQTWGIYVLIAGNGLMGGIFAVLTAVAWPRFFGREHLGAISGFSSSVFVVASAIGPITFSKSLTLFGSYDYAAYVSLIFVAVMLILAFKARNPQFKEE